MNLKLIDRLVSVYSGITIGYSIATLNIYLSIIGIIALTVTYTILEVIGYENN